jgi:hypothetical protein
MQKTQFIKSLWNQMPKLFSYENKMKTIFFNEKLIITQT